MPTKKEIIFPMFLECCRFAQDVFWQNVFEDLAYGKAPYGTYISNGSLCCGYKDRKFNYIIERKDPQVLHDETYGLLSERLKLLSQKDKAKKKIDFYSIGCVNEDEDWASIRKKNTQDYHIENFALAMKRQWNLTLKQTKHLLSVVTLGRVLKIIKSRDIEFDGTKVTGIDGITFADKKVTFERDIYTNPVSKVLNCVIVEKSLLSDTWEKLVANLRKIVFIG